MVIKKDNKKSTNKSTSKSKKPTKKVEHVEENNTHYENKNVKQLFRSNEDKMISGVCGGIAEYLNIDAIWIRLIFLITLFMNGVGLIAYIIFWILVPENPNQKKTEKTVAEEKVYEFSDRIKHSSVESSKGRYVGGLILISIGGIFLFEELFWEINWDFIWPVLLILFGVYILVKKGE